MSGVRATRVVAATNGTVSIVQSLSHVLSSGLALMPRCAATSFGVANGRT